MQGMCSGDLFACVQGGSFIGAGAREMTCIESPAFITALVLIKEVPFRLSELGQCNESGKQCSRGGWDGGGGRRGCCMRICGALSSLGGLGSRFCSVGHAR
jgi:hypothetical protein